MNIGIYLEFRVWCLGFSISPPLAELARLRAYCKRDYARLAGEAGPLLTVRASADFLGFLPAFAGAKPRSGGALLKEAYILDINEVLSDLKTSLEGLDQEEVIRRQKKYGLNQITQETKTNFLTLFWSQFRSPLVYILIFASLISYFLGHNLDALIILAIVLFNALVGWLQEIKAEKSLQALKKILALKTRVIRGGEEREISALELTPGDLVAIEEGTKIPADLRIIKAENLKIDESVLTGESIPVHKKIKPLEKGLALADQTNMLFAGTIVATGRGLAVVTTIGQGTEIGQISQEVAELRTQISPLLEKISQFSKNLLFAVLIVSGTIFFIGLWRGFDFVTMFLAAVAAAVSIIPEGLPAIITITLAIGLYYLSKKQAIIRRLAAVETLGSVTVIAADKTGTLTRNQMTLERIVLDDQLIKVTGDGYEPRGEFKILRGKSFNIRDPRLQQFLTIASLCNDATLVAKDNLWEIIGDPTEASLLVAAAKAGLHRDDLALKFPRLDEIPFSAEQHFMATLHQDKERNLIAVKGTLEKILVLSDYLFTPRGKRKLTPKEKERILAASHQLAGQAYRILAVAFKRVPATKEKIENSDINQLVFVGFCGLDDPPRPEAKEAIEKCQRAGIRPMMITGDYPATALAIGIKLGLASQDSEVLTGEDLDRFTLKELKEKIGHIPIYARVTPKQKLKIIEALQSQGEIVGMTGDGVNDAPVLKKADIGIAMGQGGTDVAREASEMILVDNNFATIVNAVEEGRTIFSNIKRAVFFLLSTNAGEAMILLTGLLLGLPLPLIAVQILWINLITDSTSGLSLAIEPTHPEVMELPPRPPKEGIVTKIVAMRIFLVALVMTIGTLIFYWLELKSGASIERARSVAFVTMAIFQIFNLFNCRSFKTSIFKMNFFSNLYLLGSFCFSLILTLMTVYSPFLRQLFHTVPLAPDEWLKIILLTLSVIVVVETEKWIRRRVKTRY